MLLIRDLESLHDVSIVCVSDLTLDGIINRRMKERILRLLVTPPFPVALEGEAWGPDVKHKREKTVESMTGVFQPIQ